MLALKISLMENDMLRRLIDVVEFRINKQYRLKTNHIE